MLAALDLHVRAGKLCQCCCDILKAMIVLLGLGFVRQPVVGTLRIHAQYRGSLGAIAERLKPKPQIEQHLCCNTIPWRTVAEFNAARDLFEQWRHKHDGQLKTLEDWHRWEQFQAGTAASRHRVRRSKDGVVGQALRIFRRAYVRRKCGLPGGSYKRAADSLTAAGYPTKEQHFKNTLRDKSPLPEHTIPADAPGVRELVGALLSIWPEFEWERLVLDPEPDYLRQISRAPQANAAQIRKNAGEFQSAV
jgi:hypothetical protein